MIYFLPTDREFRADVVQHMQIEIRNVQAFYAEAMKLHGYGESTFQFETDAQGEPVVHRVDGKHTFSHYEFGGDSELFIELEQRFNFDENIYLIVLGADSLGTGEAGSKTERNVGGNGGRVDVWGKGAPTGMVANVGSQGGAAIGIGVLRGHVQVNGADWTSSAELGIDKRGGYVTAPDNKKGLGSKAWLGISELGGGVNLRGKGKAKVAIGINQYGNGAVSTWDKFGWRK